jgi:hypothetical protein
MCVLGSALRRIERGGRMAGGFWGSSLSVRVAGRCAVFALLLGAGAWGDHRAREATGTRFVDETIRGWCGSRPDHTNLQAVVVEVHFLAEPPVFAAGDGVVVAPVGLELPSSQRLLEVASDPPSLRTVHVDGVTALTWPYAGRMHRDMRFVGVALFERPPRTKPTLPGSPSFSTLAPDLKPETLARASEILEHRLQSCAGFHEWALKTAGEGPYTERLERIVRGLSGRRLARSDETEDVCAAIREGSLPGHWAQVAAVLGAREAGIPAFGFLPASSERHFLVGTYVDGAGWVLLDIDRPDDGFFTGGPPLITMAPLLGGFDLSRHDLWMPEAAAYAQSPRSRATPIALTAWPGDPRPEGGPSNTTEVHTVRLSEACR